MSTVLIIDDSDPTITYSGNWVSLPIVGVQTGEYNTTVHKSSTAGDRLSYTFDGTGISVYGTLNAPGLYGPPNALFSIDGQTPSAFNSTGSIFVDSPGVITSYVRLYESASLTKGTHTLVVSSGTPANASALLYFDFLTIETGSDSASGNIIVDDRDASIKYVGDWRDAGVPWEYMITTKGAPDTVAGGTATFRFNGTSITVFGTTTFSNGPNTTAAISFTIDEGPSTQFNAPQNSGVTEHTPLFHAEGLSNTQEHTIVMTSLNTNSWWLDCMVYTTRNSSIAGGGGGSSVTGPETGASGGGGPNVGAIAGGVVAGLVALLAIAGIISLLLRRRKVKSTEVKRQSVGVVSGGNIDPSLQPFIPSVTGAFTPANLPASKQYDSNPRLAGGDRMGQPVLDLAPSTSYSGGTSSTYSSVPPGMSQYSDGESQQVLTPVAAGPGPGYGHQSLNNPLYPRFDPGVGRITHTYQRDSRQDYGHGTGQPFDQKALFHGHSSAPITPAVATRRGPRPPPSSVPTIEEDSGIRIPTRAPPIYTPD